MSAPQRGGTSQHTNKSVLLYATQRKLSVVTQKVTVLRNDLQELERELAVLRRNVPSTVSEVSRPRTVAVAPQPVQQRQKPKTITKKRSVKHALTSSRDKSKQAPRSTVRSTAVLPLMARYRPIRKKRRTHIAEDAHFNRPQEDNPVIDLTSSQPTASVPDSVHSARTSEKSSVHSSGTLKTSPVTLANISDRVIPRKSLKDPPASSLSTVSHTSVNINDCDRKPKPVSDNYKTHSEPEDTKPRAKCDKNPQEHQHSQRASTTVLNDAESEDEDPDSEEHYIKHTFLQQALRDYYCEAQLLKDKLVRDAIKQYGRGSTHTGTQPECASTREELRSLYRTLKAQPAHRRLALYSISPTCLVPLKEYLVDPALLNQSVIDLRNPLGDILSVQVPDGNTWKFTGLPRSCVPTEWTILEE